jgi:HPt (histidine-containing phosphotransfer) domain-containing protein
VLDRWLVGATATTHPVSSSGDPADEVLDAVQFDGLRRLAAASGDPSFLRNLVDNYLDSAGCQLAELRQAAALDDVPAMLAAAHGLRGTSATIGAAGVATACQALENSAVRGEVAHAGGLDRVAGELKRATTALLLGAPSA